jgi:membrane-associated phospholipid phosphatase
VLYQAELYPEFRLDPLPEGGQKGNMVDLSRRWPAGLGTKLWWIAPIGAVAAIVIANAFDRDLSVWGQGLRPDIVDFFAEITRYGESDWILIPAGLLLLITVAVALLVRWKLMRTMLWQFSALYAFIFFGVGVPSLVATLAKRAIGRGRPDQFDQYGLLYFRPNWADYGFQGFPSGHATTAFALAMVLAFLAPRWTAVAMVFGALVAASRVIVGAHYPSDVVAGAIVGILGAYLVRLVFAQRGWGFRVMPDGSIQQRAMSSLRRYLILKRRGSAPAPRQSQP